MTIGLIFVFGLIAGFVLYEFFRTGVKDTGGLLDNTGFIILNRLSERSKLYAKNYGPGTILRIVVKNDDRLILNLKTQTLMAR